MLNYFKQATDDWKVEDTQIFLKIKKENVSYIPIWLVLKIEFARISYAFTKYATL